MQNRFLIFLTLKSYTRLETIIDYELETLGLVFQ